MAECGGTATATWCPTWCSSTRRPGSISRSGTCSEPVTIEVTAATAAELPELADVAAETFPLACPPSVTPENVAAFIDENLSQEHFARYLTDIDRLVLVARQDGRMIGYAMLIRGVPDDDDVQRAVTVRPAVEISKMYVLPGSHGAGGSAALMFEAIR